MSQHLGSPQTTGCGHRLTGCVQAALRGLTGSRCLGRAAPAHARSLSRLAPPVNPGPSLPPPVRRGARAWSLKPNAVGATLNTSLVDCRMPLAAARVLLCPAAAATATSGTCDTRMPSRARNLPRALRVQGAARPAPAQRGVGALRGPRHWGSCGGHGRARRVADTRLSEPAVSSLSMRTCTRHCTRGAAA